MHLLSNASLTSSISTLSLHDALPISKFQADDPVDLFRLCCQHQDRNMAGRRIAFQNLADLQPGHFRQHQIENNERRVDRKSTRLNSSHVSISYAVFCLKKKTSLIA